MWQVSLSSDSEPRDELRVSSKFFDFIQRNPKHVETSLAWTLQRYWYQRPKCRRPWIAHRVGISSPNVPCIFDKAWQTKPRNVFVQKGALHISGAFGRRQWRPRTMGTGFYSKYASPTYPGPNGTGVLGALEDLEYYLRHLRAKRKPERSRSAQALQSQEDLMPYLSALETSVAKAFHVYLYNIKS